MSESNSFLDPTEAAKPPSERLAIRGRPVVDAFSDTERLFLRVPRLTEDERHPLPADLGYPGSDGMSTNRERFSIASDVLWPHHLAWGAVAAEYGALAACRFASGDGLQIYDLFALHDPTEQDEERGLPENYAHTLVCTRKQPGDTHVTPSSAAKKKARQLLAAIFKAVVKPSDASGEAGIESRAHSGHTHHEEER